jgi:hypothetical protein
MEKEIEAVTARYRSLGLKGPFKAVPVQYSTMCFAPCGAGKCDCLSNLPNNMVLVIDNGEN